jgi:hypothetical protein
MEVHTTNTDEPPQKDYYPLAPTEQELEDLWINQRAINLNQNSLIVKESRWDSNQTALGLGVFAATNLPKGTIMLFPAVKLAWRGNYHKDQILLSQCFNIPCDCIECATHGEVTLLPLGVGPLINATKTIDDKNTDYLIDQQGRFIAFYTTKAISKGEEILTWFAPDRLPIKTQMGYNLTHEHFAPTKCVPQKTLTPNNTQEK